MFNNYINENRNIAVIDGNLLGRNRVLNNIVTNIPSDTRLVICERVKTLDIKELDKRVTDNVLDNMCIVDAIELESTTLCKDSLKDCIYMCVNDDNDYNIDHVLENILPNSKVTILSLPKFDSRLEPFNFVKVSVDDLGRITNVIDK